MTLPIPPGVFADGEFIDEAKWFTRIVKPISDGIVGLRDKPITWTAATLTGAWSNYNAVTHEAAGYRRAGPVVSLKGTVKGGGTGAASPIFTLPAGYWPAGGSLLFLGSSNNSVAEIAIDHVGQVYVTAYRTGASNAYVSLDGISFCGAG